MYGGRDQGKRNKSYLKDNEEQKKTSYKQSFMGFCTNMIYKFKGIKEDIPKLMADKSISRTYFVQGRKCQQQTNARVLQQRIIWFTYRTNFKINDRHSSDVGWGCLIRVGQMLLAAALTRHFTVLNRHTEDTYQTIIAAFLDENREHVKYSLHRFLSESSRKEAGDWFHISEVSEILRVLHTKDPMKGGHGLKVLNFNDSIIYLNEIYQALDLKMCKCLLWRFKCVECGQPYSNLMESKFKQRESLVRSRRGFASDKKTNNVLVIVSARLGVTEVEPEAYHILLELLELKSSLGLIGGIKNKALYLIGKIDDKIIYLDPHLAQEAVNSCSLTEKICSFSCSSIRTISAKQLDPSVGIAFFIQGENDIEALDNFLEGVKRSKRATPFEMMKRSDYKIKRDQKNHKKREDPGTFDGSFVL